MAALIGWLVACWKNHTHGSEEKNQDLRRSGFSTCTDALHDAATNIIATRKDRNDTFMADPASYSREIENRRETTSLVSINSDAPMVAEARSTMLSSSSALKNAQARAVASAQATGANSKAETPSWRYRGPQKKGNPGQRPTPMAKDSVIQYLLPIALRPMGGIPHQTQSPDMNMYRHWLLKRSHY